MALAKDLFSLSLGLLILNGEKDVYLSLIWNLFYSIKKHKRVKAASFIWHHYHFSGDEVKVLVTHSCLTLRKPMDSSMLGFTVHHQHPEPAQTHVHWVGDAIQPSQTLSSSSPAFSLSQHQGLFQWVSSLHQVTKVLEFQLQHHPSNEYSGLISFRMD